MTTEQPASPNGVVHPSVQYERTDLGLRGVFLFGAALVATLAVVVAGLFLLVWMILGPTPQPQEVGPWHSKAEPGPDPNTGYLPGKPELEAIDQNAPKDNRGATRPIREQVRKEEEHLNGYGWENKDKGTVYIPIEQAMKRLAAEAGRQTPGGAP